MKGALDQQEDAEGVAEEFGRLIVLTGFLEVRFLTSDLALLFTSSANFFLQDDEPAQSKGIRRNGFT
jgi:hypothetical protein